MPATQLTKVTASIAGVDPNYQAADAINGNSVANTQRRTYLLVAVAGAVEVDMTIAAQMVTRPADANFPAVTVPAISVQILPGTTRLVGPFPLAYQDSAGLLQISWSSSDGVTIAPFDVATA